MSCPPAPLFRPRSLRSADQTGESRGKEEGTSVVCTRVPQLTEAYFCLDRGDQDTLTLKLVDLQAGAGRRSSTWSGRWSYRTVRSRSIRFALALLVRRIESKGQIIGSRGLEQPLPVPDAPDIIAGVHAGTRQTAVEEVHVPRTYGRVLDHQRRPVRPAVSCQLRRPVASGRTSARGAARDVAVACRAGIGQASTPVPPRAQRKP